MMNQWTEDSGNRRGTALVVVTERADLLHL